MISLDAPRPSQTVITPQTGVVAPTNSKSFKSQLLEFLQRLPSVDLTAATFKVTPSTTATKEPIFKCTLYCPELPATMVGPIPEQYFEGQARSKKSAEHVAAETAIRFYQERGLIPKSQPTFQSITPQPVVIAGEQHFQPQYQQALPVIQGPQMAVSMQLPPLQQHQQVLNQPQLQPQSVQPVQQYVPVPYATSLAGWVSTGSTASDAGVSQGMPTVELNSGAADLGATYTSKEEIDEERRQLEIEDQSQDQENARWEAILKSSLTHQDAMDHLKTAVGEILKLENENRKLKKLLNMHKSFAYTMIDGGLKMLSKEEVEAVLKRSPSESP